MVRAKPVAAGGTHSCAITAGKTVRCWGDNTLGQIGKGTTSTSPTGVSDVIDVSNAVHIAAGKEHTCVIKEDATVQCWGANTNGRLGDDSRILRSSPVAVKGLTGAVALALGGDHSCALLSDKTVACWGGNGSGQIGDGTKGEDRLTPVKVKGISNIKTIAAGYSFTCATTEDTKVYCWGDNTYGQIGVAASPDAPVVEPKLLTLSGAEAVTTGGFHTCVSLGTKASCWGLNDYGELGDAAAATTEKPVQVKAVGDMVQIEAGSVHTCGVGGNGQTKCWGVNDDGRFGNGTTDPFGEPRGADNTSVSTDANTRLPAPESLSVGGGHVCALASVAGAKSVFCWGNNLAGQSGAGAPQAVLYATAVTGAL